MREAAEAKIVMRRGRQARRVFDELGDGILAVVADVARRTGFRIDRHRLELFGLCPACQAPGSYDT